MPEPILISQTARQNAAGIRLMLSAVLMYGLMDALIKYEAAHYSVIEIMFFRNLFALPPLITLVLANGGWRALRTRQPRMQALRAVSGFVSLISFIDAFALLPLADVVAIGFSAPLFITALSVPLLAEQVGWHRWSAVLVGFVGVLIMAQPGSGVFSAGAIIALFSTACYAVSIIAIRRLSRTDSDATTIAFATGFSLLATGGALPFYWLTPVGSDWIMLAAMGLLGGIGQIAFTRAFALAPPVIVAPFDYSNMLLATLLGFLIWDDIPGPAIWVGGALVIASGIYIIYREALRRAP